MGYLEDKVTRIYLKASRPIAAFAEHPVNKSLLELQAKDIPEDPPVDGPRLILLKSPYQRTQLRLARKEMRPLQLPTLVEYAWTSPVEA